MRRPVLALALTAALQACASGPGTPAATYERDLARGRDALEAGRPEDAVDAFQAALDLRAEEPDALHGLARAQLESGDAEAALRAFARLEAAAPGRVGPGSPELQHALRLGAESRMRRGDSAGALRLLRRLAEAHAEAPGLEALLADALLAESGRLQVAGRPEAAEALLRELAGSEADGDLPLVLARRLMAADRVNLAISVLSDALLRRPDDPRLRALMDRALRIRYPNGLY